MENFKFEEQERKRERGEEVELLPEEGDARWFSF